MTLNDVMAVILRYYVILLNSAALGENCIKVSEYRVNESSDEIQLAIIFLFPTAVDQLGEYCHFETFNASCEHLPGHVVVMTSARYGRMKFGRCMREDHGSVGCSADVLPQLDRKCSGRPTCHVTIPDAALHNVHPCPRELMPYLEASYSCLPGKHTIPWAPAGMDKKGH